MLKNCKKKNQPITSDDKAHSAFEHVWFTQRLRHRYAFSRMHQIEELEVFFSNVLMEHGNRSPFSESVFNRLKHAIAHYFDRELAENISVTCWKVICSAFTQITSHSPTLCNPSRIITHPVPDVRTTRSGRHVHCPACYVQYALHAILYNQSFPICSNLGGATVAPASLL